MSREVILLNNHKKVIDISGMDSVAFFGNEYHFLPSRIQTFDISSDDYGGVVCFQGNPLGVIGVPSSVTGDDSIRVISLFNMDYDHPETGTESSRVTMRNSDASFIAYKTEFTGPYWDNNNSGPTTYNPPFIDGWHDHNVQIQLSDSSGQAGSWRTSNTIPHADVQNRGYSPASLCCWRYNPISEVLDMQGYWYLPSMHELIEEGVHLDKIDAGALTVKNTYNVGIGRIPYDTSNYADPYSYWASRFIGSQTSWGGNSSKYDVKFKYNRSQYYATAADPGQAQAWCKLIKNGSKWILDPAYHIN